MRSLTLRDVSVTIGSARDSSFSLWSSSTCPSRLLSSLFIYNDSCGPFICLFNIDICVLFNLFNGLTFPVGEVGFWLKYMYFDRRQLCFARS